MIADGVGQNLDLRGRDLANPSAVLNEITASAALPCARR